ncbi:MAG: hypothetical protein QXJ28_03000 [Candidatus Pacearchaeota archaeon]
MLKKINKNKFQEACKYLEKVLDTKIKWKYVKGFTEINDSSYNESRLWFTFISHAINLNRNNLWHKIELDEKIFSNLNVKFFRNLAESNVLTVLSKNQDITDILVVENPEVKVRTFTDSITDTLRYSLHSLETPAVVYEDGVQLYAAEGMYMEDIYYNNPEAVTAEDISKLDLERRRLACLIMGAENFFRALGSEPKIIDSGIDNQGNMMELIQFYDHKLNKKVKTLKVVCPSTQRIYYIYPPNQNVQDVWAAKASTFNNQKLAFRQGDVGLQFLDKKNPDKPFIET